MALLSFFAFLSGIVTILSPCILPVLPIVLSGSVGGKRKPLGVVLGFILSFSLFTLALSTLVRFLNIPPDSLRIAAVVVIGAFGLVLVIPRLQAAFEVMASRMVSVRQNTSSEGFGGGIAVGAGLGLLWTPCVGPIMASVISLAVSRRVDGGAILIVLSYSVGTAIPMFAVMIGGRSLIKRFPRLTANTGRIQKVFGAVMVAAALVIGLGLDRRFQSFILETFPNYGSGLTSLENIDSVREALDRRRGRRNEERELSWRNPPENGRLADYGPAPEIVTEGAWFNSEPLTMKELEGKVVLVDFWTYSCVNCVRTLPYLRSWHERYADDGLVIIGVHSPEFAFERNANNLRKAIEELEVTWPVVQDNNFAQWRAYDNRYWPAHYFIDTSGTVRYFHFGEGEYERSERLIRQLLEEAGTDPGKGLAVSDGQGSDSRTPETYLGYARAEGFLSEEERIPEKPVEYRLNRTPENGEWNLEGIWTVRSDFIESQGEGALELGFHAGKVYLVVEPLHEGGRVSVTVDGEASSDTRDVRNGVLTLDESRLYDLVNLPESGSHVLRLTVDGAVRFYAFTFG